MLQSTCQRLNDQKVQAETAASPCVLQARPQSSTPLPRPPTSPALPGVDLRAGPAARRMWPAPRRPHPQRSACPPLQ